MAAEKREYTFPRDGVRNAYEHGPSGFSARHPDLAHVLLPGDDDLEEDVIEVGTGDGGVTVAVLGPSQADKKLFEWARSFNKESQERDEQSTRIRRMLRRLPRDADEDADRARKRKLAEQGIIVLGKM